MHAILSVLLISTITTSAFAENSGSWYDEVGVQKGVHQTRGFTADTPQSENLADDSLFVPVSSSCQINALAALGWKIERTTRSNQVLYSTGNPCDNSTIQESIGQGELRVQIPEGMDEATLQNALNHVLGSKASVCAYKFKVAPAVADATWKLKSNQNFYFYSGGFPLIEFTRGDLWWGSCNTSSGAAACFYPRTSNSASLQEFYSGRIGTECALGLQAAEYSTLRELYGDASFNSSFRANEIVFAGWGTLNTTRSATWGNLTDVDSVTDKNAVSTSKMGAFAFTGVPGYIGNVYGEAYLDTPVDRGENYLTVSVSLRAASELAFRGGFNFFNQQNVRLYELGGSLTSELEELALTSIDPYSVEMTLYQRIAFKEMQQILANPVYQEYKVFVHPLGVMSFGQHVVRQLRINPRTPYAFQLYVSRMNRGQYARYVNTMLSSCR